MSLAYYANSKVPGITEKWDFVAVSQYCSYVKRIFECCNYENKLCWGSIKGIVDAETPESSFTNLFTDLGK